LEGRFDRAFRDISSGPRQRVYQLVLRHERIVRALAARGAVKPPLVQTAEGVEDPLVQEAARPATFLEKVSLRSAPTKDPDALAGLLEKRNAELLAQLQAAGGSEADLEISDRTEALAPPE